MSSARQKSIPDAIDGLDLAIDSFYPHTHFYKISRKFYHRTIEGTLKPEQEERLRALRLKLRCSMGRVYTVTS